MRIETKDIFAVNDQSVKHLRPPPPKWGSVFCGRQNTLAARDETTRHGEKTGGLAMTQSIAAPLPEMAEQVGISRPQVSRETIEAGERVLWAFLDAPADQEKVAKKQGAG